MLRLSEEAERTAKESGAYYTPDPVAAALVQWAARMATDRLLDPSCGDGRFIACHPNSTGVERDQDAACAAKGRAPSAVVHPGDFFEWAEQSTERFDCAAGNPPFIRYQTFSGEVRRRALRLCHDLGVSFSGLTTSWAPFLVVTAGLLRRGGRMAFVVPASIGHAPHATPLIDYLVANFEVVRIVPIREKLFPHLSEDCWLLFAEGFGGSTRDIHFAPMERFRDTEVPPRVAELVPVDDWRSLWNRRLRPYLLKDPQRATYQEVAKRKDTLRLGLAASVGIGYVSGANDFFHLRPSEAQRWGIPDEFLHPTVRNGRILPRRTLTADTVDEWRRSDEPMLLLRIPKHAELPRAVSHYLDSPQGQKARQTYKCRNRNPWYSVPDVRLPQFFLTYMSGVAPSLVRNEAGATCTNALHAVYLHNGRLGEGLLDTWDSTYVQLSCEIEGHALGGGMLKLEPGEAARIVLPSPEATSCLDDSVLEGAVSTLRRWRHYGTG
ncbi:MAG: class I SAM-dependent methyltransferase [Gammaproteobacteria bacterium]|nr:class I SAM-dependent methyltransferase [Gammaproteobacteria bacterium]